jgi:hypothetical protein
LPVSRPRPCIEPLPFSELTPNPLAASPIAPINSSE